MGREIIIVFLLNVLTTVAPFFHSWLRLLTKGAVVLLSFGFQQT
jgi:hypothetical protein